MEQEKLDQLSEVVFKQLKLKNNVSKKFITSALGAIETFDSKHTEKGLSKLDKFGPMGVIIKMDEKYESLADQYNPKNAEKKQDNSQLWEDVAVYSLMGKIIENGDWE